MRGLAARLKLVGALSASVDILHPDRPKRIVIVASNPAVSEQTGGPIGFWWPELSHPFLEFTERGYEVRSSATTASTRSSRLSTRRAR